MIIGLLIGIFIVFSILESIARNLREYERTKHIADRYYLKRKREIRQSVQEDLWLHRN